MGLMKLVATAGIGLALGACDHVRTHSVSFEAGKAKIVEAEAPDHLIYFARRADNTPVTCAAPSPDAIQASAFAAGGSGGRADVKGAASLAHSQTAAYVGMRTQTVQLLRDGYYRLCEAYMNGALTKEQYNLHLANMPRVIALAMAVDAVAGAAVAPPVAITPATPAATAPGGQAGAANATAGQQSLGAANRGSGVTSDGGKVLQDALKVALDKDPSPYCFILLATEQRPPLGSPLDMLLQRCGFNAPQPTNAAGGAAPTGTPTAVGRS